MSFSSHSGTKMTEQTNAPHTRSMPSMRIDEFYALAEMQDALFTSQEARAAGIADSVFVRSAWSVGTGEQMGILHLTLLGRPIGTVQEGGSLGENEWRPCFSPHISRDRNAFIRHLRCQPCKVHITVPVTARLRRTPEMDHHSSCGHHSWRDQ